jgi:hypothetical protein
MSRVPSKRRQVSATLYRAIPSQDDLSVISLCSTPVRRGLFMIEHRILVYRQVQHNTLFSQTRCCVVVVGIDSNSYTYAQGDGKLQNYKILIF